MKAVLNYFMFLFLVAGPPALRAQSGGSALPLIAQPSKADPSKPMIFYITGDGGWNAFSRELTASLVEKGYPVLSLDASKYFWKQKTAAQASIDAGSVINKYAKQWGRKKIIMLGYSFGADVIPFIYLGCSSRLASQVQGICLLSPSEHTDFEVHLLQMLGGGSKNGESVIGAINSISTEPILLVFGDDEKEFPILQLSIKNYKTIYLQGGHHYEHAIESLSRIIVDNMDQAKD
jgi:type IV secretory pathway VirJ component